MWGAVQEESRFVTTRRFFWWAQPLAARRCEQQKLQDLELWTPRTYLWVPTELFGVSGLEHYLQNGGNTGLPFWRQYCPWRLIQWDVTVLYFPKLANYPSDMNFEQHRASPHYATPVTQYLDHGPPNMQMERGGPATWPARFLDWIRATYFSDVP